jgi:hypothetical protein
MSEDRFDFRNLKVCRGLPTIPLISKIDDFIT